MRKILHCSRLRTPRPLPSRRGKKIYVTMNIFARNGDLKEMARYAAALSQTKAHGVIVSDPGAFLTVREAAPELPLHVSTQANTLNWRTCEFWKKMGAVRVNLARELTLSEIAEISARLENGTAGLSWKRLYTAQCACPTPDAVCSAIILPRAPPIAATARSPAAGTIKLRKKTGPESLCRQRKPSAEHFFLILKDLCMLPYLQELKDAGITSFKIEGRMKSEFYTAITVRAYRLAIDAMECGRPLRPGEPETEALMEEVCSVSHRDYSPASIWENAAARSTKRRHTGELRILSARSTAARRTARRTERSSRKEAPFPRAICWNLVQPGRPPC